MRERKEGDEFPRPWRDNTRATLEAQLDSVIEELHGWIDYRRDNRLKDQRNVRLRRRAEENPTRTEARTKRQEECDELLHEIVEMGRKAEQLRTWMGVAASRRDIADDRVIARDKCKALLGGEAARGNDQRAWKASGLVRTSSS